MRSLAHKLSQQPVLIAGRGDVVHVAHTYGFQQVMTTHQIARAMPTALPFRHCIISEPSEPCPMKEYGWGTEACPIAAALVMTDPDDWYQDLQLLADVITSHGVPARLRPVPGGHADCAAWCVSTLLKYIYCYTATVCIRLLYPYCAITYLKRHTWLIVSTLL